MSDEDCNRLRVRQRVEGPGRAFCASCLFSMGQETRSGTALRGAELVASRCIHIGSVVVVPGKSSVNSRDRTDAENIGKRPLCAVTVP